MGRQKIFEVRELDNDVSFLRNYLTEDLIKDLDLYLYKKEGDEWVIAEKNWEKVRDGIVASMTNFGYPYLVDRQRGFRGQPRTLHQASLRGPGTRPGLRREDPPARLYHLGPPRPPGGTIYENKRILLTYDGERNSKSSLEK